MWRSRVNRGQAISGKWRKPRYGGSFSSRLSICIRWAICPQGGLRAKPRRLHDSAGTVTRQRRTPLLPEHVAQQRVCFVKQERGGQPIHVAATNGEATQLKAPAYQAGWHIGTREKSANAILKPGSRSKMPMALARAYASKVDKGLNPARTTSYASLRIGSSRRQGPSEHLLP